MTSKFFPPVRAAVSALGLWLLAGSGALYGQASPTPTRPPTPPPAASATPPPAPAPTPSPTPHKPLGWVRFWNMLPEGSGQLELVAATDPNRILASANNLNVNSDYNEMAPGRYAFQVFRAGDRQTVLKSFDVPLRDGTYVTILAHEPAAVGPGGTPTPAASPAPASSPNDKSIVVELLDDTPPDLTKADNKLTVRQFVPGTRVIVATASKQTTEILSYGGAQTLSGMPNGVTALVSRASNNKTGASTWNTEADFTTNWRSTLLLINDGYGRFRPRITNDGPPKPTPTPKP